MASRIEREIAADNGMWLTRPRYLKVNKKEEWLSADREKTH